jgi:hypothetical protein
MQYISAFDYILLLIYVFLFFYIIKIKAIKYKPDGLYKYFIAGFWVHMAGCILYAMVIQYYYGYGDSFGFYQGAQVVRKAMASNGNPINTFFADTEEFSKLYKFSGDDDLYMEAGVSNSASLLIYKITAALSYICFNRYLLISLFFGLFSFAGVWKLFCIFNELLQKKFQKWLAYTVLFLPSICFWGSGLMKDSICLGLVGFIFSAGYNLFVKKHYKIKHIVVLVGFLLLLFVIKSYIASVLIATAALTYLVSLIKSSSGNIIKFSMMLLVLLASGIFLSFNVSSMLTSIVEDSKKQIEIFKTSYESNSETDDTSMGGFKTSDFDFTIGGIILNTPQKIGSTLFRPFVWETRKPIMLFSVMESLLMLLASLYVLIKCRVGRFFYYIAVNPETFFAFVFVNMLAAVVGFTTFNFGTLVRYRLPLLPFFFFLLISVYSKLIKSKTAAITLPVSS